MTTDTKRSKIFLYYQLTKPGIIKGNLLSVIAGFGLATSLYQPGGLIVIFFAVLTGSILIMASGCVFNNFQDRHIDALMSRTKKRSMVTGQISHTSALVFGTLLFIAGTAVLSLLTNGLTTIIGLAGWAVYVLIYTPLKPRSRFATHIGSLAGAAPAIAGYVVVSNRIDKPSILLGLALILWQMAHFYAIAIFRREDYNAAKVPVTTIVKSVASVKRAIIYYIISLNVVIVVMAWSNYISLLGLIFVLLVIGVYWLLLSIKPLIDQTKWAKTIFGYSLLYLVAMSIFVSIGNRLP